jgi:hypothetical protein
MARMAQVLARRGRPSMQRLPLAMRPMIGRPMTSGWPPTDRHMLGRSASISSRAVARFPSAAA